MSVDVDHQSQNQHREKDQERSLKFDLEQARLATAQEHNLTLSQALRTHRKAIAWSMLFSLAIVMEGYDTTLLQSFFAFPEFAKRFGSPVYRDSGADGETKIERYELPAPWQSALTNGAYIGEIFGLFITGFVSERVGYRVTMLAACTFLAGSISILFFARNLPTLLVGEILCGVPWGVFQALTTAYAAEICPVALRGYLTTYVNLCWVVGQMIASGVLRGFLHRRDDWSFRVPFALQWVWLPPIVLGVYLGPESPWWLVRRGRVGEARGVLKRLRSRSESDPNSEPALTSTIVTANDEERVKKGSNEIDIDNTLSLILYTTHHESQTTLACNATSYTDCIRSTDARRTEITCITWAIQALCGSSFMGYSTYFYQQAGLDVSQSFNMSLGQYVLGILGTLCSWVLMGRFGRRSLYVSGLFALMLILFAVGFMSLATPASPPSSSSTSEVSGWIIGSLLLLFTFTYDISLGPVCYAVVSEIPSSRLRGKTIVLARNVYNIAMIVNGVIVPRMLNPTAWGWGARSGFFFAGVNVGLVSWAYFRLPETKGRTFAEVDCLFGRKVRAREFAKMEVEVDREVCCGGGELEGVKG